ncbi:hypothetical protein GQ53DRAFT_792162 [Thozetella sp. PMI_491]|nr:hypothetical protein GQ53DRAFT_792162 [Thozetella sp. PMI_491]
MLGSFVLAYGRCEGNCITRKDATPTIPACAVVSSSWASQIAANPTATPAVSAAIAHDCLNSIPLNTTAAILFVDGLIPYMEWQTDIAYKADPPKDYPYPAFDMFTNLALVKTNLQAGNYDNEYEFQQDLYNMIVAPAHDGHFAIFPDALTVAFEWRRQKALVSISEDGTALPVIKLYEDVIAAPNTASVIKLINGIDASTYVGDTIFFASSNQDKDAAYNTMFYSLAHDATGSHGYFANSGRVRYVYPGPNTTVTFENGTVLTIENLADVKANMTGVTDGPSFYSKFCAPVGIDDGSDGGSPSLSRLNSANGAKDVAGPGYPGPVVITSDGTLSGYYLEGDGLDDVAVLAVLSFAPISHPEFQAAAQEFFADAKAAGKTKLVVDLQANGGGFIMSGYDLFRQLFPSIVQDGFSRMKETDTFRVLAELISDEVRGFDPFTGSDDQKIHDSEIWYNYGYDYNITDQPFASFEDKFAPHVYKDTNYTSIMRWNLNDNLTTTNTTYGFNFEVTGYGSLVNATQPFAAEDIILLYDGFCASTCTLFSEMMRIQGGVKSIALGGRPTRDAIQGVGGVKGALVLDMGTIGGMAFNHLFLATTDEQIAALDKYGEFAVVRTTASTVNARDQILRNNLNDGLPAQYVVELSDCRLYWTTPMISDATEIWKAAANAAFNGAPLPHTMRSGGMHRSARGSRPTYASGWAARMETVGGSSARGTRRGPPCEPPDRSKKDHTNLSQL